MANSRNGRGKKRYSTYFPQHLSRIASRDSDYEEPEEAPEAERRTHVTESDSEEEEDRVTKFLSSGDVELVVTMSIALGLVDGSIVGIINASK